MTSDDDSLPQSPIPSQTTQESLNEHSETTLTMETEPKEDDEEEKAPEEKSKEKKKSKKQVQEEIRRESQRLMRSTRVRIEPKITKPRDFSALLQRLQDSTQNETKKESKVQKKAFEILGKKDQIVLSDSDSDDALVLDRPLDLKQVMKQKFEKSEPKLISKSVTHQERGVDVAALLKKVGHVARPSPQTKPKKADPNARKFWLQDTMHQARKQEAERRKAFMEQFGPVQKDTADKKTELEEKIVDTVKPSTEESDDESYKASSSSSESDASDSEPELKVEPENEKGGFSDENSSPRSDLQSLSWPSNFEPTAAVHPSLDKPKKGGSIMDMFRRIQVQAQDDTAPPSPMQLSQGNPTSPGDGMDVEEDDLTFKTLQFNYQEMEPMIPDDQSVQSAVTDTRTQFSLSAAEKEHLLERADKMLDVSQISTMNDGSDTENVKQTPSLVSALRQEMAKSQPRPSASLKLIIADDEDENDNEEPPTLIKKPKRIYDSDESSEEEEEESDGDEEEETNDRPILAKSNFLENEAEVEEDEFMFHGGADGDDIQADEALREELAAFIALDEKNWANMSVEEIQERLQEDESVAKFFAEQMKQRDLKETAELVKDVAAGRLGKRRRHGGYDESENLEIAKFGREEEDEDPKLRELDDVADYGMFADIIHKYIKDRQLAAVQARGTLTKRKRHDLVTKEDEVKPAGAGGDNDDEDVSWLLEPNGGPIQILPGATIETDFDKLEEKAKKRALLSQMDEETRQGDSRPGFGDDDLDGSKILKMIKKGIANKARETKRIRTAFEHGETPVFKTKSFFQQQPISEKKLSPTELARLRSTIGLTEEDMKAVKHKLTSESARFSVKSGGGYSKGGKELLKKVATFSIGSSDASNKSSSMKSAKTKSIEELKPAASKAKRIVNENSLLSLSNHAFK